MRQIVVPVDGSEGAGMAAQFAARLARDTGAALTLLHVYEAPTAAAMGFEALSHEEMEKTKNYVAQGSFDAARRAVGDADITIETHVAIGYPGHEIVTFAKTRKADVVVMGSRGLGTLESLLVGSVSEYVVRRASCPVTIVR